MFGKKHPDKPLNDIDHVSDVPGAPGPDGPASSGTPSGGAPRKHGILPYVLAGVAVGIALLTIGTAGLVAYDRATNPAWQQPADGAGEGEPGQTADEDEADADETDAKDDAAADDADADAAPGAEPAKEAPAAKAPAEEVPAVEEPTEPPFVQRAREELGVPDDPSITYEIGEPYYWEGVGVTVTPITFYEGGAVCASADCSDDGSPATSILRYPGTLAS